MVEATLISSPRIDFGNLFLIASQTLGRKINGEIDSSPRTLSDPEKFIVALESFSGCPTGADFFLHYVFICYADKDTAIKVREWTKLDVLSQSAIDGGIIFLLGGCLYEWKRAALECCSVEASFNLRLLFDKIVLLFEREDLWFNLRKKTLPDRTFLLEDMH